MNPPPAFAVYGAPDPDLADVPPDAVQVSPIWPGSVDLETLAPQSMAGVVMAAPPGTLERRHDVALALTALKPGAALVVMAPKDKGGSRLGKELSAFGCVVEESGRRHQRVCVCIRPESLEGLEDALAAGRQIVPPALGMWSQPGVFSWDRLDPGTALLLKSLPALKGRGADLGCGVGVLAKAVLGSSAVTQLDLVDIDRRAVAASHANIDDPRVRITWADALTAPTLEDLHFVVCNPPFHHAGAENPALGLAFIQRAKAILRPGGVLWMVANRHLPYERALGESFKKVERRADAGGFKVYEARR